MGDLGSDLFDTRCNMSLCKDEVIKSKETIYHLNLAIEYQEAGFKAFKNKLSSASKKLKNNFEGAKYRLNTAA